MELEFSILYFIQSLHTGWLDSFMTAVTRLGDHGVFWIITGAVLFCFKRTRRMGFCVLLSITAGFLIGNIVLKNLISRSRPCWIDNSVVLLIANPRDYSFPSGHTLVSFEGAVSILLYKKNWGIAALALAVLIACSRLYLFVHFPTDILGGMALGIGVAYGSHMLTEKFLKESARGL